MTTENNGYPNVPQPQAQPYAYQYPYAYPQYVPPAPRAKKEKRIISGKEKLLLLAAIAIAVLFDRLVVAYMFSEKYTNYPKFYGAFWLSCLAIFYLFHWKSIRHNFVTWYLTACVSALCLWSFFFWDVAIYGDFAFLSFLIIPAVLMGLVIYMTGDYKLKDTGSIAISWLCGFFVFPFSGIAAFFEALGALLIGETKAKTKKVIFGLAITFGLLIIILPLLSGADKAFGYFLTKLLTELNISILLWDTVIIAVFSMFFYSFMWKTGHSEHKVSCPKITSKIDTTISYVVLGSILLIYALFCTVQFSYLFAGAGLPGGMTYSEYAREGFAQTVAVCAINLLIFGVFKHFGEKTKAATGLLLGLLALTASMLFSGFIRLGLYIDAYGMTWLRLLSAWFIIYLAVVIVLCCINLRLKKLPLLALCALILIGWYVVLGYLNPDGLIAWYNDMLGYDAVAAVRGG
ncbi:MAG: DUF4173 domain-containing protein [Oscillospiraceae bacterium]|nr:DUF4173 domain-containing protein [Oscillospiraceae bacterium]